MSRTKTLKSLEIVLESFLDRAVGLKEERLKVLDGINRLDNIARDFSRGNDKTEQVGGWFAEHSQWLGEEALRPFERNRISQILNEIKGGLSKLEDHSPAHNKINQEIERWSTSTSPTSSPITGNKIILKRGSEEIQEATPEIETDTNVLFSNMLSRATDLFKDFSGNKQHVMTTLDDLLSSANQQNSKEALILSAWIIYYLRQGGYKVEPFVKRLRDAEQMQKGISSDA